MSASDPSLLHSGIVQPLPSADESGNICFPLNAEKIIRLNPKTGGTETVYTFEKNLFPDSYA